MANVVIRLRDAVDTLDLDPGWRRVKCSWCRHDYYDEGRCQRCGDVCGQERSQIALRPCVTEPLIVMLTWHNMSSLEIVGQVSEMIGHFSTTRPD